MKRTLPVLTRCLAALAAAAVAAVVAASPVAAERGSPGPTLMTMNMFQGSELEAVLAAQNGQQLAAGVTTTYHELLASDPVGRTDRMAAEIAAARPDLVGLQEAALWRIGTGYPATTVLFDLVQMEVAALAARGQHYRVVAITDNLDAQAPSTLGFWLRFTDRVAILAREGGPDLHLANVQTHNFAAAATFTSPALGTVRVLDGWASVDTNRQGRSLRFVTTHLAAFSVLVRQAQVAELVAGPAATTMPLAISGDFNFEPGSAEHAATVAAGWTDAWSSTQAGEPGFTCCAFLPTDVLTQRIDYVFLAGDVAAASVAIVGADPAGRTATGQWPSDHAALVVRLEGGGASG